MTFNLYVGIDYSGAETPESRIKALQMYAAKPGSEPTAVRPPSPLRNWSRRDLAHWLLDKIESGREIGVRELFL